MSDIISIILVAVSGVAGNVAYFEYRLKGERHKEILQKRLTQLLLPLYYTLKDDELSIHAVLNSEADPYEYVSEKPNRLYKDLSEIIKNNLYLAAEELHKGCIKFIEWVYKSDENERFQRVHESNYSEDKVLEDFFKLVCKKYDETRNTYLK
jgi:hypothetical protein